MRKLKLRKFLLLINVLLTGFIFLMATNIIIPWASDKKKTGWLEPEGLKKAGSRRNVPHKLRTLRDYQPIIHHDIFKTTIDAGKRPIREEEAVKATNMNLRLKGTAIGENRESYAVIWNGVTHQEDLCYLNDLLQGARITQIMSDRVILRIDGRREALIMSDETEERGPVSQISGNGKRISPKKLSVRSRLPKRRRPPYKGRGSGK